jgi:Baseplate J-like protein
MPNIDIKYLNKDFTSFKSALIEYAKAYFPSSYNDFSTSSPGTMFIDMASYVGDVMSFYLDNQIQENFLEYAKQYNNLYTLAYMFGYRPKVTSAAITTLDVYQQIPASGSNYEPDFNYAMTIAEGLQVRSNVNTSNYFYCPNKIDFNLSSSANPTEISVYTTVGGNPNTYLLKKQTQALSGQVKTTTLTFGAAERFPTRTIQDNNIIEIISVYDDNGNRWYEVPYLAQNFILNPVANTAQNYPELYQEANQVPYIIERLPVPNRFVSRFTTAASLELEFGAGIQAVSGTVPNPFNVGIGTVNGVDLLNTAYDPTNFVVNSTYGIAPSNVNLTVNYLVGGGAGANVNTNVLTNLVTSSVSFTNTVNPAVAATIQNTLATNNSVQATGGGDGDSVDGLKLNTLAAFPSQMRAVTQQDYLGTVLGMPGKFGQVAKAYVTKDNATFAQYVVNEPGERDPLATSIYLLSYDALGAFTVPGPAILQNIQTYLEDYRMLTDTILLKPAYIINIQVNFSIILRPNYTSRAVLQACIVALQTYFKRDNWQINQPIILSDIYSLLDQIDGVQTVQKVAINNIAGTSAGYSQYSYDISAATLNGVIYPSLDPSIFEVKYPDIDIQGRIVTM